MQVNFNVLNQEGAPSIFEAVDFPDPGFLGRLFFSRSGDGIYYDTGDNWLAIATLSNLNVGNLQQVTDQGNSTTNKIELINNDSTVDALSIQLNESNQGINIFDSNSADNINIGLIINFVGGESQNENTGIFCNVNYGVGILSQSISGWAGFFGSVDNIGLYVRSLNTTPLVIDSNNQTTGICIEFRNQITYSGAAIPAAEYLPIYVNGTEHLIRLFAPV